MCIIHHHHHHHHDNHHHHHHDHHHHRHFYINIIIIITIIIIIKIMIITINPGSTVYCNSALLNLPPVAMALSFVVPQEEDDLDPAFQWHLQGKALQRESDSYHEIQVQRMQYSEDGTIWYQLVN